MKVLVQRFPPACRALVIALPLGLTGHPAHASDFLKCVDPATGNTTYTNQTPPKGLTCTRADGSPLSVIGSGSPQRAASKASAPATRAVNNNAGSASASVDASTQRNRDSTRRQVLETELASEEQQLNQIRTAFNNGRPVPLADEGVGSAKYIERVQQLEKALRHHERNIAALRQEIGRL